MNHPANMSRNIKCGWLRKQGGMVKSWHRRWFVLNGDILFYFAKEDDLRPLGTIFLPGNKVIQHPANPDEPDKFLMEVVPEIYAMTRSKSLSYKSKQVPPKMTPNHESFLLCASSDDERQDWVKAIRRVMFSSVGGAIFGGALEDTMEYERKTKTNRRIPYIVEASINFLLQHGLETEGIFRLPGRLLLVRDLKDRFDEGEKVELDIEEVDVHSVASMLKLYLRELPESLIPYQFYQEYMNIAMKFQDTKSDSDKYHLVQSLRTAMSDLPQDNYNLLKDLCSFLNKVAKNTHINKMTALNLATVFGPNIIRHPNMEDNPEIFMLTTADISQQLAYMFINYDKDIFTIEFDKSNVAVDQLLSFDDVPGGDVLKPQPFQPTPARRISKKSSGISELSDIVFEQAADRRGRSFSSEKLDLDFQTDGTAQASLTPTSADASPTTYKATFTEDGNPIPPLRKKYTRNKHNPLSQKNSDSSVSSEHSGSERSLNSIDEPDTMSNNSQNAACVNTNEHRSSTVELDLQQKLDAVTADYNALKVRYENLQSAKTNSEEHVKNLRAQLNKVQAQYDEHIRTLEARHKSQMQQMCAKLVEEQSSQSNAVQKIIELQKELHEYQMHYGDIKDKLPPLYK